MFSKNGCLHCMYTSLLSISIQSILQFLLKARAVNFLRLTSCHARQCRKQGSQSGSYASPQTTHAAQTQRNQYNNRLQLLRGAGTGTASKSQQLHDSWLSLYSRSPYTSNRENSNRLSLHYVVLRQNFVTQLGGCNWIHHLNYLFRDRLV